MITVTSDEKKRIEGQMKTGLPFLNEQIDSVIEIVPGMNRSRLTLKQENEVFELPIFYISPSADDTAWEAMLDQIEETKDASGVFFIRFHSEQHTIQNASTYVLTNLDLYGNHMLSDVSRLCNYVDLEPYQVQLFDVACVNKLLKKMSSAKDEQENLKDIEQSNAVVNKIAAEPIVNRKVEKKATKQTSSETESDLDSDIRALINECFGIF